MEQTLRIPIRLTVSEPETRGSYLTKYTVYLVKQDPQNYKVRRRFSDFEWLQRTLMNRYIGIVVPSLPEKNVYKTESFIRSRMRALNLFLAHLVQVPYFTTDASVLAFTSVQDDKEWENAKKVHKGDDYSLVDRFSLLLAHALHDARLHVLV